MNPKKLCTECLNRKLSPKPIREWHCALTGRLITEYGEVDFCANFKGRKTNNGQHGRTEASKKQPHDTSNPGNELSTMPLR